MGLDCMKLVALYVGVRGFPLRPIPSLGAMGPGPGHLGKFFSARRRRRRRRRPWGLFFKNTKIPATRFSMNHIQKKHLSEILPANCS